MSPVGLRARIAAVARALAGHGLTLGVQLLLFPACGLQPALGVWLRQSLWFTALLLLHAREVGPLRVRSRAGVA